jgi:hypothetical protein
MWLLTVIDDSIREKYLEIESEKDAINIQILLIENGWMVKREKMNT